MNKWHKRIKSRRRKGYNKKQAVHYFDYSLLAIIIFLMCFGLVMLYSISSYEARTEYGDGMYFPEKAGSHRTWKYYCDDVGFSLDYHMFSKYAAMSYWGSMLLLALVKFTPLGIGVNGARRWFRLPANQVIPAGRDYEDRCDHIYPIPDLVEWGIKLHP